MIGRLRGQLALRGPDHALIDVGGVGYIVHCSERTLAALPPVGAGVTLYTELLVREDLLQLFGFLSPAERDWHRLLTSVQGVGAKAALAILGTLGPEATARAVLTGDWGAVRAAPGVGPKLAQRVVNELRDKAPAAMALAGAPPVADAPGAEPGAPAVAAPTDLGSTDLAPTDLAPTDLAPTDLAPADLAPVSAGQAQAEALSALTNLGYGPSEAARAVVEAAAESPAQETPALIRAALRRLAPAG